jgi:cell division protein FtsB
VPIAVVMALGLLGWVLYPALKLQYQTSRRVAGLEQKYDSLRKRNETLRAEVAGLKTPEGVAKAASEGLGFTKQGENLYVVMPSKAPTSQAEAPVATRDERSAVQIVLDAVFGVEEPASVDSAP